ncbi:hypothetical protein CEXT_90941 [Caerostris extrusa]|uniref:Uncharacterized protein n=1 Tax=Caerostris extrusa TaxID=172846 RepID=A0AAV4XJ11_CAEEX|nr:hypothetical protein CEXT_90941 [Caerostris extrusa]
MFLQVFSIHERSGFTSKLSTQFQRDEKFSKIKNWFDVSKNIMKDIDAYEKRNYHTGLPFSKHDSYRKLYPPLVKESLFRKIPHPDIISTELKISGNSESIVFKDNTKDPFESVISTDENIKDKSLSNFKDLSSKSLSNSEQNNELYKRQWDINKMKNIPIKNNEKERNGRHIHISKEKIMDMYKNQDKQIIEKSIRFDRNFVLLKEISLKYSNAQIEVLLMMVILILIMGFYIHLSCKKNFFYEKLLNHSKKLSSKLLTKNSSKINEKSKAVNTNEAIEHYDANKDESTNKSLENTNITNETVEHSNVNNGDTGNIDRNRSSDQENAEGVKNEDVMQTNGQHNVTSTEDTTPNDRAADNSPKSNEENGSLEKIPNSDGITSERNATEIGPDENSYADSSETNVDPNLNSHRNEHEQKLEETSIRAECVSFEQQNEMKTKVRDPKKDGDSSIPSVPEENACLEKTQNTDGIPSVPNDGEKIPRGNIFQRDFVSSFLSLIRKAVYREKSTMAISSRSSTDEASLCPKSIESTPEILLTVKSTEHPEQEQKEINTTSLIDKRIEEHDGIKLNDTKVVHLYADQPQLDNVMQESECSRTQVANGTNRETLKEKKLKTSDSRKVKTKEPGTTSHGTIPSKEILKNRKSTTKLRANQNPTEESRQNGAVKKLSPQKYPKEGENCIEKKKSHFLKEENSQSFDLSACRPKESTDSPLLMQNAFLLKHGDLQLVVKDRGDYSFSYTTSPKYDDQGNIKYHKQEFSLKKKLLTEEQ